MSISCSNYGNLLGAVDSQSLSSAKRLFDSERFIEAKELLTGELVTLQPSLHSIDNRGEAAVLLGMTYVKLSDIEIAVELYAFIANRSCEISNRASRNLEFLANMISFNRGLYAEVLESAKNSISFSIQANDLDISDYLFCSGYAQLRLGNSDAAKIDLSAGYYLAKLKSQTALESDHAIYLGIVEFQLGRYTQAIEWYSAAISAAKEVDSSGRVGKCLLNTGICHYKYGSYSKSLSAFLDAEHCLTSTSDTPNLTRTHIATGNVHRLTRDFPAARQHLMQAYTMACEIKLPREECLALEFLGDVYRDEGNPEEARRYYQRGMAIALEIAPEGDLVMELLRREGECLILEGKAGTGLEILIKARNHAKQLGDRFEEGVTMRCLAEGLIKTNDLDQALSYAQQAADQLQEIDARHEHAIACLTAGEVLQRLSQEPGDSDPRDLLDQAWEHALIAQSICRDLDIDHWTSAVKRLQSSITKRRAEELKYIGAKDHKKPTDSYKPGDIVIAESRGMKEALQAVDAFAPYDESILLTGETGTGKEVIARRIHQYSLRKDKPFVAVNITAIPQTMFEREFFGHVKGAFSGADSDQQGLAGDADGGTLFLDEIGDLSPQTQAKLLRILQDGSYLCLGDPEERRADLRIIAATNVNLMDAVAEGTFREDLYYRLAVLAIPLPPLRERPEDIGPLLDHFLSLSAGRHVTADRYFNDLSLRLLAKYKWPGNVREVALVARRAHITQVTMGRMEVAVGSGENAMVLTGPDGGKVAAAAAAGDDGQALSRARIMLALEETSGNRTAAAQRLGVSRATFYRHLTKLGLDS